jgi:hypothetical protein
MAFGFDGTERPFHNSCVTSGRLNASIVNGRDAGVTRRPRIDVAQATVPASCDKESADKVGTFLP